jgi:long-chain acyl-CoA synthetase
MMVEDRYWLKSYPPGVPADINPSTYASLRELIEASCRRHAGRTAYTSFGHSIRYADLERMSRAFGACLQQELRLAPGSRIAIMLPNVLQYPVAVFGALRAGYTIVNTNPLYTHRELAHQLQDSGAAAIVVFEQAAHLVEHVLAETSLRHVIVTGIGDLLPFPRGALANFVLRHVRRQVPPYSLPNAHRFRNVLELGRYAELQPVAIAPQDVAFLQYTGGTTGVAKGAVLTHRNVVANTLQAAAWLAQFKRSRADGAVVLAALPLYHIFALTANALLWLYEGGENVLIANPRDLPALVRELASRPFSHYFGVNTLYNALLHDPNFAAINFASLEVCIAGGMALQESVATRWKAATGCILSQGWGLTETSPVAAMMPARVDFNGSIGLPVPSTRISIRDDAGAALPVGTVGEICVAGPQVMRGYWKRPDETANVLSPEGWLRTGDVGRMDQAGFVYIEDRKKDMILVSGFNVYPNEVEGVLARHPGVREVAAVPQPDEHSGEAVAVFVVRNDAALTAEALITFARTELTGYKVPKHVYFRDELPKTNVGKILRRALRDELLKHPG